MRLGLPFGTILFLTLSASAAEPPPAPSSAVAGFKAAGIQLLSPDEAFTANVTVEALATYLKAVTASVLPVLDAAHLPIGTEAQILVELTKEHPPRLSVLPASLAADGLEAKIRAAVATIQPLQSAAEPLSVALVLRSGEAAPQVTKPPVAAWGPPVPAPALEQRALEALKKVATVADPESFAKTITVGPALWAEWKKAPAASLAVGVKATILVPSSSGMREFEGRTIMKDDISAFAALPAVRALGTRFGKGRARPATDAERALFYSLIPFELKDMPVTVVEEGGQSLLVFQSDGRMMWLDLISEWHSR